MNMDGSGEMLREQALSQIGGCGGDGVARRAKGWGMGSGGVAAEGGVAGMVVDIRPKK